MRIPGEGPSRGCPLALQASAHSGGDPAVGAEPSGRPPGGRPLHRRSSASPGDLGLRRASGGRGHSGRPAALGDLGRPGGSDDGCAFGVRGWRSGPPPERGGRPTLIPLPDRGPHPAPAGRRLRPSALVLSTCRSGGRAQQGGGHPSRRAWPPARLRPLFGAGTRLPTQPTPEPYFGIRSGTGSSSLPPSAFRPQHSGQRWGLLQNCIPATGWRLHFPIPASYTKLKPPPRSGYAIL